MKSKREPKLRDEERCCCCLRRAADMSPLCRGCWNGTPAAVKKQYHEIAESYVRGAGYRKPVKMRALGAAMRILIVAAKRALQERRDRRPARPKKINRQLGLSGLM